MQEFMEREGVLLEDGTRDVPSLEKFEAQIAEVHAIETDIQAIPAIITEGLLRINTKPLQQALVVLVSKWIYLYTQSLQRRVCFKPKTPLLRRMSWQDSGTYIFCCLINRSYRPCM